MVIVSAYHKETKYFNSKFDRIPQQLKWLFSEEKNQLHYLCMNRHNFFLEFTSSCSSSSLSVRLNLPSTIKRIRARSILHDSNSESHTHRNAPLKGNKATYSSLILFQSCYAESVCNILRCEAHWEKAITCLRK